MPIVAALAAVATLAAAAAAPDAARAGDDVPSPPVTKAEDVAATPRLRFHVPGETVAFHGVVSNDGAGLKDGPILYAGGPAGLVAGVIAHSLISNSRRQRQKDEIAAQADAVLDPYADAIAGLRQRDLLVRSLAGMTTAGGKSIGDEGAAGAETWVIDYVPVFAMNQDRRAIVLDNDVSITRLNGPAGASYRNTIRIVSAPVPVQDTDWWEVDHFANIAAEGARLLAMSFDLALSDARWDPPAAATPSAQRTLRFLVGADERMERAEPIGQTCDRIVMRTLRGWIQSAPPSRTPATDGAGRPCATAVVAAPG